MATGTFGVLPGRARRRTTDALAVIRKSVRAHRMWSLGRQINQRGRSTAGTGTRHAGMLGAAEHRIPRGGADRLTRNRSSAIHYHASNCQRRKSSG